MAYGWKLGGNCWPPSTTTTCWTGMRPSWTAASCPRKRGRWSWQNQARQGHEVDGTGRWPGHSTGSATGERFTGRGRAGGKHARGSEGAGLGTWSSTAEAPARNCGPGLRLRPAARATPATRYRTAGSPSPQPATLVEARRPQTSTVQEAMENRAHLRVAPELPSPAGAPRPHPGHLSRLFPSRLLAHHAEVFMKPALVCRPSQLLIF